jgi:transcriptional regulator with XRE-family HTH domain
MDKSVFTREYEVLLSLLRSKRRECGLTQVQLSKKLGTTQSTYSKIERGEQRLDVIQLRTIGIAIGISLVDFVKELEKELRKPAKRKLKRSRRK